jgi:hypothetical protein
LGAEGATIDWYTSRNKTLNGEGLDRRWCPARCTRADRAREMGHDELRGSLGPRFEYAQDGFPAAADGGAIKENLKFSRAGRTIRNIG